MRTPHHPDLEAQRARLDGNEQPEQWRSLSHRQNPIAAEKAAQDEFGPSVFPEVVGFTQRRDFLKLMGASFGVAGISACVKQPEEKIIPFVRMPEELVPGRPRYFATAISRGGYATGVLVESHMSRPTKVDGNELHPASLGGSDSQIQAEILELYDPDRSQTVKGNGHITTWARFTETIQPVMDKLRGQQGKGLAILTGAVDSPTLGSQLSALVAELPQARWHRWESANRDNVRAGARMAFGEFVETRYVLDDAKVVVTVEADLLGAMPGSLAYARKFMAGRRDPNNYRRLYSVESSPSLTGASADHRFRKKRSEQPAFLNALAAAVGVPGVSGDDPIAKKMAEDLMANRGRSVVVVGDSLPAEAHALAHAINAALGNAGTTVIYTDSVEVSPVLAGDSIADLAAAMDKGEVELLICLGTNPIFDAPADLAIADKFNKVALRVHAGLGENETSRLSHWHIPLQHGFENWSDARAFDGTVSIVQPLVSPMHQATRSIHEFLGFFMGAAGSTAYEMVRGYWKKAWGAANFESNWRRALHDGVVAGSAYAAKQVTLGSVQGAPVNALAVEVTFSPDPTIYDGRYANNGWLQETPKPFTKLTWDNAALISPATMKKFGLEDGNLIELVVGGRTTEIAAWTLPGQADDSVAVQLGYGRTVVGKVGAKTGFDVQKIRGRDALWAAAGDVRKTNKNYKLASTQDFGHMNGRNLVRTATLAEFAAKKDFATAPDAKIIPISNYAEWPQNGEQWGMAIDLGSCIGCNACLTACVSENNIAVVGKSQILVGRELHWIRIDRYFEGSPDDPKVQFQPLPCMHCERAPCEPVCPVAATVHGEDGINQMVYNRCVGTRYCSNNCPYKVRRFNFGLFTDWETPSLKAMRNPDVTVRSRGVMEKCTYCIQRVASARIEARKQNRRIRDGEIVTACQTACPTEAITFGDIADPKSKVSQVKASALNYTILNELNTKPRTSYLAKLSNPNPALTEG